MVSLIITLISIALVAALAAATLYHLRGVYERVHANAQASGALSQAQQLAGSARAYKAYQLAWPADLSALTEAGFLAAAPGWQGHAWQAVPSQTAAFHLSAALDAEACRSLNQQVRGDFGIYNEIVLTLPVQCYGTQAPYSLFVFLDQAVGVSAGLATVVPTASVVANPADATWQVAPN